MEPYYTDESVTLWHGDCLDVLRTLPDASIDAVVTDPPYDLTSGKKGGTGAASLNVNSPAGRSRISTGGFMGKEWDSTGIAFRPEVWAECLRVLKPGGHLLAFGGTRTSHRMTCAIEDAGFEIRDSIAWLYGSGFPKSLDVSKAIDKADGYWRGTVAANVTRHGTGALNIDGCRVGTSGGGNACPGGDECLCVTSGISYSPTKHPVRREGEFGRWPANVVLDGSQADALDKQSGTLTSGANPTRRGSDKFRDAYGDFAGQSECDAARGADSGGASRFFPTFSGPDASNRSTDATFPTFRYEAKAGTFERPRDGNTAHPTVKPLELMRWLVRLVTPPGGTVLEPFAGSGTTAEACILEGFKCVAIEREADYLPLIVARLSKPLQVALGLDFGGVA